MPRKVEPIKRLARAIKRGTRPALEATFRHWLDHIAPEHFTRGAFARYPQAYAQSAKRDLAGWRKGHRRAIKRGNVSAAVEPLVKTGRFEQAFLNGSTLYSGPSDRLHVRWASIPRHATMRNRFSGFRVADAVTKVSEAEERTLAQVFNGTLLRIIERDTDIPVKSHGRFTG